MGEQRVRSNGAGTAGVRVRLLWTALIVALVAVVASVVFILSARNADRLGIVDARLRDTGRFAEARARLQARSLEAV
ncbi:MAG: hypothetical protein KC645_01880, partial [Gemmatimonadetes bacterium]|nr:hypothetical protein [Gemmatimonadota bacterium]